MLRGLLGTELVADLLGWIVIERPGNALEVHRQVAQGAGSGRGVASRAESGFGKQGDNASATFATCGGRRRCAEPFAEPEPEDDEKAAAPASQAAPAAFGSLAVELATHFGLGLRVDKVAAEGFENDHGGVPAARVQVVREHADGVGAAAAQVAAHECRRFADRLAETQHLAAIGAVADDAERLAGYSRKLAAEGAARRSQGIDRGQPCSLEQILDLVEDRLYYCYQDRRSDDRRR